MEAFLRVKRHTVAALVLGAAALLGTGVAVTASAQEAPPAEAAPPTTPPAAAAPLATDAPAAAVDMAAGEALLQENCNRCHEAAPAVESQHLSREGWQGVIERMTGYGLEITDEQSKGLVDYLAAVHPAPPM
jgi:mono/diheme cytochrome c family protein